MPHINHTVRLCIPAAVRVAALCCVVAAAAGAQSTGARHSANPDSVFARAKQLVVNGNGAAGRVLVDSMVAAAEPDTPAYAEALYWRASLAAASRDAERDYRKIIVEYPLSQRAGDALLQLGQLEAVRGDRAAAVGHLEQYLLENPSSPDQGRVGLLLVRLSFEMNDARHGCTALTRALAAVPADAVEMRNQLEYYSPRCTAADTAQASPPPPAPTAAATPAPTRANADKPGRATKSGRGRAGSPRGETRRDSAERRAEKPAEQPTERATERPAEPAGRFTLQIAAYTSRADADHLAKKLTSRGIAARVAASGKLFRVRVGHYATRSEATAAAKQLKAKKIDAFVTDAEQK